MMDASKIKSYQSRGRTSQEEAVYVLLHQIHYRMRDAQDCMFEVLKNQAKHHCSGNLAMGFSKAEMELKRAAAAMRNIRDLGVCFPGDPVELDERGIWVPIKDDGEGQSGD